MGIQFIHAYEDIISLANLLEAWKEFVKEKRFRKDVQKFERNLMGNIISLHNDLETKIYNHGPYQAFNINDPKPRKIHKAPVRDRLLHHAIHRILYPFFDRIFIPDSFSCRLNKGTHKAINRFRDFGYKVSLNNTRTCWVLKCDIRKFFENIDHTILMKILSNYIPDQNILWLLGKVITSFSSKMGVGLPLGNLTSQLFVNIYMNEFDKFVKHKLGIEYYLRYADDFVILSENKNYLSELIKPIGDFLLGRLGLSLHPDKVFIQTLNSGVDFLGWVNFPDHRVLRTTTKRRMFAKLLRDDRPEVVQSYLGLLGHGNAYALEDKIRA